MKMLASKYSEYQKYYLTSLKKFMDASTSFPHNGALVSMSLLIHFELKSLSSSHKIFSDNFFHESNLFSLFTKENCLTERIFVGLCSCS